MKNLEKPIVNKGHSSVFYFYEDHVEIVHPRADADWRAHPDYRESADKWDNEDRFVTMTYDEYEAYQKELNELKLKPITNFYNR